MNDDTVKNIALIEELETSIRLIKLGLGEYQNLDLVNDFYYLPFQLISSGFERFMKCHICLGHIEKQNVFPNSELFRNKLKHDLLKLKNNIVENYFQTGNAIALKDDLKYISEDIDLKKLISLLSEFGKFARYHNLNVVTGEANPGIDVKSEWEEFETSILLKNKDLIKQFENFERQKEVLDTITRTIIIKLERFARALARQFTLGKLSKLAQQYSSIVYPFLMLNDDQLGITDYRKQTTAYKEKERKPHKRTFIDDIDRKTNKKYSSRTIRKSEYNGDWPFYNDEIIIECRDEHWCIVSINGYDYALNGAAKGRFKIEDVHEAGMAILGKSVGPFIDLALKLGEKK
jgi:hypothetical protein